MYSSTWRALDACNEIQRCRARAGGHEQVLARSGFLTEFCAGLRFFAGSRVVVALCTGAVIVAGTHTGDLMGLLATGKRISVEAVDIGRIENGQAKERWGGLNMYSMLTQLGVIPAPRREHAR